MLLSSSSSSVITTSTAAGNGAYEATTLYSDYPLDKEQRWREDRERPSVHIVGPLPHQCAGHETVFRTTDGQICKPLDETEFWFYKICLREFPRYKPFVPAWHGCVLLSRKKLLLLINSLADDDDDSSSSSGDDEPMELQAGGGGGGVFDTLRPPVPRVGSPASPGTWSLLLSEEFRLKLELDDMPSSSAPSRSGPRTYRTRPTPSPTTPSPPLRQRSSHRHLSSLSLSRHGTHTRTHTRTHAPHDAILEIGHVAAYIVLEDLTAGYDFPCTLGTSPPPSRWPPSRSGVLHRR
jgi:hypothetical protein